MRGDRRWLKAAALLAVLPLLLALSAFALPGQYTDTYLAALPDKAAALEAAASPRIVLIGGSGTAFDFNCELLEELFPGYTAVNFGLYADLGVPVMLELALPSLRAGDIVVFSPEANPQTLSDWFGVEAMWQAAEENPALLARLSPSRWEAMLAAFPAYAARKAGYVLEGRRPQGEGVYARAAFTEKGDIRPELRPANRMDGGWDRSMPLALDSALVTEAFARRVNEFASACAGRGAAVYVRLCAMNSAALAEGEAERAGAFDQKLRETLACPLLGSSQSALMEAGWFYDTNFHLNGAGALVNTARLAEELRRALGDDRPVSVTLPEMPPLAGAQAAAGSSADEDCFLYQAGEESFSVTGLTAEGLSRAELTVPASHLGLPVTGIAAGAFAGADRLAQVTLPGSIRGIEDGAFAGCAALERIVLLQASPSACTVGQGLLQGTSAALLVPEESWGAYCASYFWARYTDRLRSLEQADAPFPTPLPTDQPQREAQPQTEEQPQTENRPQAVSRTGVAYLGNGGLTRTDGSERLSRELSRSHLRTNTLQGTVWFERSGYVLTGWNTRADGSGETVGLGSRAALKGGDCLWAQWQACSPEEDFTWEAESEGAFITGYLGADSVCVLPESLGGLPLRGVRTGAFRDCRFSLLVIPPCVRTLADGAFDRCGIEELILYDSLEAISDSVFRDCVLPRVLRIDAAVSPAYSGTYFDAFQDRYDRLLSLQGQRKLILSSGSSGRYGYDSTLLAEAFPELAPVNMGVYAWTNQLPQLALILDLAEAGDVLLFAPEFDAAQEQFCGSDRLDTGFWAMMESNYDAAARLDMRRFEGVYDSLGAYLQARRRMSGRDYEESPAAWDDDGSRYTFPTYNLYGDFVLPRPNSPTDERLRHNIADYTTANVTPELIHRLNSALAPFAEKGVTVLFTYTPRNSASLTEGSTPQARQALHELLQTELEAPVISEMEDFLLPGRYFWLIDSHTSTEGARIRTERVIRDLQAYFDKQN